jgi:hypothetical protein
MLSFLYGGRPIISPLCLFEKTAIIWYLVLCVPCYALDPELNLLVFFYVLVLICEIQHVYEWYVCACVCEIDCGEFVTPSNKLYANLEILKFLVTPGSSFLSP